RGDINNN
nr:Chain B, Nitric oxide synthase, inducible [Homo sapiens]